MGNSFVEIYRFELMCGFAVEMKGSKPTEEESELHERMIARYLGWDDWRNVVEEGCIVLVRIRADIRKKPKEFWEENDPYCVLILVPGYKRRENKIRKSLIEYLQKNVSGILIEEKCYNSLRAEHIKQNKRKDKGRDQVYVIYGDEKLSVMEEKKLQELFLAF